MKEHMRIRISSWGIAVVLAALSVGVIYGSRHIFIPALLGAAPYYPITMESSPYGDEAFVYGPRINAAWRGDGRGDPALLEYRDGPAFLPLLNPFLVSGLGRLFASREAGIIASDFLFPALIFLALYAIAWELTRRRFLSLIFSGIFIFSPKFFLSVPPLSAFHIREFFRQLFPAARGPDFLYFTRLEYPKLTYLFFALAVYFIIRALTRSASRRESIAAGTFLGITFYTYLYDWVYLVCGLSLLSVFFLVRKKYELLKTALGIVGIGAALSVGYWINFFELRALPQYPDILRHLGIEVSRGVRLLTIAGSLVRAFVLSLALALLASRSAPEGEERSRRKTLAAVLVAFLATYGFVMNIQVVTGFNPQPDHWYKIQFLFIGVSVLLVMAWIQETFRAHMRIPRATRALAAIFLIILFGQALFSQYRLSVARAGRYTISSSYGEAYTWLRENAPPRAVIGAFSFPTSNEILVYTPFPVFLPNGQLALAPMEEVMERVLLLGKLHGLPKENIKEFLVTYRAYLFSYFWRDQSLDTYLRDGSNITIPDDVMEQALEAYAGIEKEDLAHLPYELDYIIIGPREAEMSPELILPLQRVYEREGVSIYAFSGSG